MQSICQDFPISNEEFKELQKEFGKLAKFASWRLIKENSKPNYTDDQEDIEQGLLVSVIKAGSYYKRQVYIEECLKISFDFVDNEFILLLLKELVDLWCNRTRHGANRQKYGPMQEKILEKIVEAYVPDELTPDRDAKLKIDSKFRTYCKAILWNEKRSMGRKISKETSIRSGSSSLSNYAYLAEI